MQHDKTIHLGGKYLTFSLGKEEYCVDILKVKEIIGMMPINSLPEFPPSVKGVINLRDHVIPIVDMRLQLLMGETEYTSRTCIIVVEVQSKNMQKCWEVKQCGKESCPAFNNPDSRCWMISGTFCRDEIQGTFHEKIDACRKCNFYVMVHGKNGVSTIGIIVDGVSEVVAIKKENIEPPPSFNKNDDQYILGMANLESGVKILLDIDQVLSLEKTEMLEEAV